jgi:hypothetical protein
LTYCSTFQCQCHRQFNFKHIKPSINSEKNIYFAPILIRECFTKKVTISISTSVNDNYSICTRNIYSFGLSQKINFVMNPNKTFLLYTLISLIYMSLPRKTKHIIKVIYITTNYTQSLLINQKSNIRTRNTEFEYVYF